VCLEWPIRAVKKQHLNAHLVLLGEKIKSQFLPLVSKRSDKKSALLKFLLSLHIFNYTKN
jgi:hypothetical protein